MAAHGVNQMHILIPYYGYKIKLQVQEALETLHDVALNHSLREHPAAFGIDDNSLYAFDKLEQNPAFVMPNLLIRLFISTEPHMKAGVRQCLTRSLPVECIVRHQLDICQF